MRKVILTIFICVFVSKLVSAQYLPNFQIGIKAGGNFSNFPSSQDYKSKGDLGYFAGMYARLGGLGFNFQPELYLQQSAMTIDDHSEVGGIGKSSFTTFNLPLLVGYKTGTENLGLRVLTGPVLIYRLENNQQFVDGQRLNYGDQNYGWQLGGGIDLHDFSIDIRYEAGINKLGYGYVNNQTTRMNLISLSISYSLESDYSLD